LPFTATRKFISSGLKLLSLAYLF
jgi:hypothetical protein